MFSSRGWLGILPGLFLLSFGGRYNTSIIIEKSLTGSF